jgi:hypothetical protein
VGREWKGRELEGKGIGLFCFDFSINPDSRVVER